MNKKPAAENEINSGSPQNASGEHARNIQAGIYIENYWAKISKLDALHQLPSPPADFTGREKEIRKITKEHQHGVTISGLQGMGGIGKTALGLIIARQLKDQYPDGQIFLDMRGAHEQEPLTPAQAMNYVLHSFDQEAKLPEDEAALAALYRSTLEGKKVLLFFDNASEQEQVLPLLPPPGCMTLVTSRQHFTLPGLATQNLDVLTPKDAHILIHKIAKGVKAEEADTIAKQCGYLPLALRLAAGMLTTRPDWTPVNLIQKLQNALALLEPVEASLELSYGLLDDTLKLRFRQLGIFQTSFDQKAAGAVWETGNEETDKILGHLLQASLLGYDRDSDRYALHDLLGNFALVRLRGEEKKAASRRHAQHYLQILYLADDLYLKGGENVMAGLALYDREAEHIRTGQAWAATRAKKDDATLSLCTEYPNAGYTILSLRLTPKEKITWLETGLAAAKHMKNKEYEGYHLGNLGTAYYALGETRKAIEFYKKYMEIAHEIGDRRGEGAALGNLGIAYAALGETRKAIKIYEKALIFDLKKGDRGGEGADLCNLGNAYAALGESRKAIEFLEKCLEIAREIGNQCSEGAALGNLGSVYYNLSEIRKAIEFFEKQKMIGRETGDRRGEENAFQGLGISYAALGETPKAIEFLEKCLEIARETGDRRGEGAALVNLGTAYAVLNETCKAIEFYEKALIIDREIGDRRGEGAALGNLGNTYATLGETRKAIEFYDKRLVIVREIGDRGGEGNALANMGSALHSLGEEQRGIELVRQAYEIYVAIESPNAVWARNKLKEWGVKD